MNPTNVALNIIYSKIPAYKIDHLKDPDQSLSESVGIKALALKRTLMKSYFSKASRHSAVFTLATSHFRIVWITTTAFVNGFIAKMSKCLFQQKINSEFHIEHKKGKRICKFVARLAKRRNEFKISKLFIIMCRKVRPRKVFPYLIIDKFNGGLQKHLHRNRSVKVSRTTIPFPLPKFKTVEQAAEIFVQCVVMCYRI